MGALDNAVTLMANPMWRQYMTAAAAYQARVVYSEAASVPDYATRRRLAIDVLASPDLISSQLAILLGTDPDLVTATSDPVQVDEPMIIQKVAGYWTAIAKQHYPPEV